MATKEEYGPVATRMLMENPDVRVWEMDLAPAEVCGLHHHTLDYVLFILEGERVGVESPGHRSYVLDAPARAAYYVVAGGIESAHNVGASRFHEALFELKRSMPAGRQKPGYCASEALAGLEPAPGARRVLENDRVRVTEATVMPGESCRLLSGRHDAAMFVAEGGMVKIASHARGHGTPGPASADVRPVSLGPSQVRWFERGEARQIENLDRARFRAVCVELK